MISNWLDLYFPLFQFDENDYKTREIQIRLVWGHFVLKFILTYNIYMVVVMFMLCHYILTFLARNLASVNQA